MISLKYWLIPLSIYVYINKWDSMVELTYGLKIAKFIDTLYYGDEATHIIVYGGYLGTGKSSYCIKALAEVYGSHAGFPDNKPDYEKVKNYIIFPPKEFVERILKQHNREKAICWDDEGLWLFALDWYDPFVKATVKYFNVMRTDWGAILGNTPSPRMIVRKVHMFPESVRVKISKVASNEDHPGRPRFAQAYRIWMTPDLKRTGVTMQGMWKDSYDAILPNNFYSWYKPIRDSYAQLAKELMLHELQKLEKKEKEVVIEKGYKQVLPEPERIKELSEVVAQRL